MFLQTSMKDELTCSFHRMISFRRYLVHPPHFSHLHLDPIPKLIPFQKLKYRYSNDAAPAAPLSNFMIKYLY